MRTWSCVAGALLLALAAGSAAAQQDTLKIGTEGAYPPYNFTNASGQLDGFEIDLGNAICQQMKVKCEFVAQDWDGMIPALQNKRFDAIMAGMSITDERKQRIDFTQGYVTSPAWFVAAKDSPLQQAETWDQVKEALKGKSVGVQTSTIHQNFLQQELGNAIDIRLYDTQENLELDLAAGRIDAALADSSSWDPFLKSDQGKNFDPFGPGLTGEQFPVFGEGVGIGVRKDDAQLRDRLNQAICALKANGTMKSLSEKWFGYDISMSPPSDVCRA